MKSKLYLSIIVNIVLVSVMALFFLVAFRERKAYVVNQVMFESFKGQQELSEKLEKLQDDHQRKLDSLSVVIRSEKGEAASIRQYEEIADYFAMLEQEISQKYTEDLWKQINSYVADFGREQGYDFIYGATGNGNLMYASDAHDITEDLVNYINLKYEGDD